MPEEINLEVAHKLTERDESARESRRWDEVIEILGVLLLAVAAVATAWGGFRRQGGRPPVDSVRRGGRGPAPCHHRRHRR